MKNSLSESMNFLTEEQMKRTMEYLVVPDGGREPTVSWMLNKFDRDAFSGYFVSLDVNFRNDVPMQKSVDELKRLKELILSPDYLHLITVDERAELSQFEDAPQTFSLFLKLVGSLHHIIGRIIATNASYFCNADNKRKWDILLLFTVLSRISASIDAFLSSTYDATYHQTPQRKETFLPQTENSTSTSAASAVNQQQNNLQNLRQLFSKFTALNSNLSDSTNQQNNAAFTGIPLEVRQRFINWTQNKAIFATQANFYSRKRPFSDSYNSGGPQVNRIKRRDGNSILSLLPLVWHKAINQMRLSYNVETPEDLKKSYVAMTLRDIVHIAQNSTDFQAQPDRFPNIQRGIRLCREIDAEAI